MELATVKITQKLIMASAALTASVGLAYGSSAIAAENAPQAAPAHAMAMNWFGGPVYDGAPALAATAALVQAGGGAEHFSFAQALVAMLGEKTVNAEVAKLTKQYGKKDVDGFLNGMTFAITDGLKRATEAGVKTLVLSHLVPGGPPIVPDQVWYDAVRPHFQGELVVGRDLMEL